MNPSSSATVFVVDDDIDVRDSLKWLLESVGLQVVCCATAQSFFDTYLTGQRGCIVLDVRMPGISGLNAQQQLPNYGIDLPVIMISAHGDVDMAVTAMSQGAITFIQKPFKDQLLLDHVHEALNRDQAKWDETERHRILRDRLQTLTPRESEVMALVVAGEANKVIAEKLAVSSKTVEGHRAKVMAKMQADSLSALIQMAIAVQMLKTP